MKTRKMKISKLERIPKLNSPAREIMLKMLTEMSEYKDAINRGHRFFKKDELEQIEKKYTDGMTWDEIESVMSGNGVLLKNATFRKYMQDEIIPKSKGYKSTEKGRVAVYESNIIRHLNFVNFFYKFTDAPMIDELMKTIGECEISYKAAIESVLGGSGHLSIELRREMTFGDGEASEAIHKALAMRSDKPYVIEMFNNIQTKYDKYIAKDLDAFEKYLETTKMLVTQIPEEVSVDSSEVQS